LVVIVRACCPAAQDTSLRATAQGWFVTATTRSQVRPRAFIDRGDVLRVHETVSKLPRLPRETRGLSCGHLDGVAVA